MTPNDLNTSLKAPRTALSILGLAFVWAVALYALAYSAEATRSGDGEAGRNAPFARWDSPWYAQIVRHGYEGRSDGKMHNIAFFPLYPLAVAAVSRSTGLGPLVAGEAVSFAAFLGAMALLGLLAREEGFDELATVRALLWFPTAFFFLAVYTEALFLLVSVGCLLALRRQRYFLAALAGLLAGLCRPNGFLLSVPVAWALIEKRSPLPGRSRRWLPLAAAAPGVGLGAFLAYAWVRTGDPLLPISIQKSGWHHTLTWPWSTLIGGWFWKPHLRFEVILTLLCFVAAALLWKRFKGYAMYVTLALLMLCLSGQLFSASRYVLVLFPVFFILGGLFRRFPWIEAAYATSALLGLGYLTVRFVLGFWVA